jgi:hypothetical protein
LRQTFSEIPTKLFPDLSPLFAQRDSKEKSYGNQKSELESFATTLLHRKRLEGSFRFVTQREVAENL